MATNTDAPGTDEATEAEAESERKPYVVVLMSKEMKDMLTTYCKEHNTSATALLRRAGAQAIGYDLSSEPQPAPRQKYTTDDQRKAAHTMASKKSGLLRKGLVHAHFAAMKGKPELLRVANEVIAKLADTSTQWTSDLLEAENLALDAAIKAGK